MNDGLRWKELISGNVQGFVLAPESHGKPAAANCDGNISTAGNDTGDRASADSGSEPGNVGGSNDERSEGAAKPAKDGDKSGEDRDDSSGERAGYGYGDEGYCAAPSKPASGALNPFKRTSLSSNKLLSNNVAVAPADAVAVASACANPPGKALASASAVAVAVANGAKGR